MPDNGGLNRVAIAVGFAVSLIGTVVSVLVVIVAQVVATSTSGETLRDEDFDRWATDPPLILLLMALGFAWDAIGGYVAGRMAGTQVRRHAAWVGLLSLVVVVVLTLIPAEGPSEPLWSDAMSIVFTIPAAIGGGALAQRHVERAERRT